MSATERAIALVIANWHVAGWQQLLQEPPCKAQSSGR